MCVLNSQSYTICHNIACWHEFHISFTTSSSTYVEGKKKKNQYLGRGILQDKNVEYSYPVQNNYSICVKRNSSN